MRRRRREVMAIVLALAGCRDRGCAESVAADGGETEADDETAGTEDSAGGDMVTCEGAVEIVIAADDSQRQLRLGVPVVLDVRAVYESGHFGLLADAEIRATPDTTLRLEDEGVLVPLAAGHATVTATACGMETSVDVEVHAGLTPYEQMLCEQWQTAIVTAAAGFEPCFAAPIPEPDCTAEETEHDAAYEALATCIAEQEPDCSDAQAAVDERHEVVAACLARMIVGDLDCGPTLAFTREQCAAYALSDCAGAVETPEVCG